jgi:hypothetical protein
VFHTQLRTHSKKVQKFVNIYLGLSQQTSECADLDWLVERNHATPAAAPHHHMAALLTYHLKAKTLQDGDDG